MAKEDNLKPFNKWEEDEQKKIAQMGGKASVRSRKRKKSMKEAMNKLLSLEVSESNKDILSHLGLEDSDMNNQMLVMVSAFQKAVKGDVSAMNFIANITGSYAMSETDRQKLKIEKERIRLEKQKMNKEDAKEDRKVTIINDLPK